MVCESLKVHSMSTTKFVDQIAKVVVEGEWHFIACHQQLWLARLFYHFAYNHVVILSKKFDSYYFFLEHIDNFFVRSIFVRYMW